MADDPQYNNYLRIVYEKQALKKDLQDTYRQLHSNLENNSSPHEKAALEKVMEDINTTEELIFSYQHKVEKIRETKESQMPQRAQTIEIHLHNGTCNVTSHHEKTIEEVCKMNNRFFSIDLSKSHLEMHTFDSSGKKERKLLNWSEPSSKYANSELWLKTTDEAYLKSVAANTHCFEVKRKSRKNCSICGGNFFSLPRKLWKCTYSDPAKKKSCDLIVCTQCKENKITKPCISVEDPVGIYKKPEEENNDLDTWKALPEDVTDWNPVGQGTWGIVYKAKWHGPVAVKELKCKNPTDEEVRIFENEVRMLRKTRHEYIILFMAYICEPEKSKLAIIMSWCESSLHKRIHVRSEKMTRLEAISIASQIAQGMGYLHSKTVGILHRDLKSANIFLQSDAKRSVKIGDFGLATTSAARGSSKGGSFRDKTLGSIPWMAPELFRTPAPYSHESDMYAFGCVLYEIFAGEIPYAAMPNLRQEIIIFRVGAGLMKPDLKRLNPREGEEKIVGAESCPDEIKRVMKECYERKPENRPKFEVGENNLVEMFNTLEAKENDEINRINQQQRAAERQVLRSQSLNTAHQHSYYGSS